MTAMDKEISKKIFIKNKILTPNYIKLKNINDKINYAKIKNYLNYPVVIKPINEGSSLDVYICNNKSILSRKLKKMKNYKEMLMKNLFGQIQVAIINTKLGVIELNQKEL